MGPVALQGFYYPVAQSRELQAAPIERKLDSTSITCFRDAQGRACAVQSACVHRGANLAHGRVTNGCIVCPYHGWRFDSEGKCVEIPSHPDQPISPRARLRTYQVLEQQGLVWVLAGNGPPIAPPPRFAAAEDRSMRRISIEEVVPGPCDWWLENFMDISHVPFVHRQSFGGRFPSVETHPVVRQEDMLGYQGRAVVRYHYGIIARLIHGTLEPYAEDLRFEITLPCTVYVTIDMGGGRTQCLALLGAPETADSTRVIQLVWRNYWKWVPGADAIGRRFTRKILREDHRMQQRCITHTREPGQATMASDSTALEFHRLLRAWRQRQT